MDRLNFWNKLEKEDAYVCMYLCVCVCVSLYLCVRERVWKKREKYKFQNFQFIELVKFEDSSWRRDVASRRYEEKVVRRHILNVKDIIIGPWIVTQISKSLIPNLIFTERKYTKFIIIPFLEWNLKAFK